MLRRFRSVWLFALIPLLASPLVTPAARAADGLEGVPSFDHVFLLIGENTTLSQLTANNAPFLMNQVKPNSAWLTNYWATSHYSTSNYVAMTSGQFIECEQLDVKPIGCHQDVENLFHQLDGVGVTWQEWNESMPSPCYLLNAGKDADQNSYRPKHNPAEYYVNIVGDYANPSKECTDKVIPAGTTGPNDMSYFHAALANHAAAQFNYVVPNMCEDGHDNCKPTGSPITQFDDFVARESTAIRTAYPDALVIVVYDEAQGGGINKGNKFGGGNVLLALMGPQVHPGVYTDLHNHYGLLRTLEDGYGIGDHIFGAATAAQIDGVWN